MNDGEGGSHTNHLACCLTVSARSSGLRPLCSCKGMFTPANGEGDCMLVSGIKFLSFLIQFILLACICMWKLHDSSVKKSMWDPCREMHSMNKMWFHVGGWQSPGTLYANELWLLDSMYLHALYRRSSMFCFIFLHWSHWSKGSPRSIWKCVQFSVLAYRMVLDSIKRKVAAVAMSSCHCGQGSFKGVSAREITRAWGRAMRTSHVCSSPVAKAWHLTPAARSSEFKIPDPQLMSRS